MGCTSSNEAAAQSKPAAAKPPQPRTEEKPKVEQAPAADGQAGKGNAMDPNNLQMKDLVEPDSFHSLYTLQEVLGRGNYSVVRKGLHKETGDIVAVKCIKESSLTHEDREALKVETAILKDMDCPHIIKLIGFYEEKSEKMYYIVTEFVGGGELFDRIISKEYYSEEDAQKLVRTVASAIKYCHERGIVHRDLKPENILLTSKDDDDSIKIADFGFAKQYDTSNDDALSTSCGTPGYVAPEILNGKKYGKEVDMWSFGVIIYILLCGYPPFHDDNQKKLFKQIRAANYQFDEEYWSQVSAEGKDLISKLLVVDGKARLTVDELLEHPWLKTKITTNLTDIQAGLRLIQNKRKVKAGINAIVAQNRLKKLLGATANQGDATATAEAAGADAVATATAVAENGTEAVATATTAVEDAGAQAAKIADDSTEHAKADLAAATDAVVGAVTLADSVEAPKAP
mmetsp:Transcript_17753/g.28739  ORF Transcript_17753/g.28739 Transcript_17753/m.28739 type:complete len:457 (+) Transcript_17753:309-1679(+)|eukprot:CAMPEP_0203749872 /NCGR_PEP_ID=MMETSP0098-20131031/4255_1 /ASSEMBLY_ACC=CAM_ASM_000208 /TAXON_ID=96639 /ORGANISM=" , Strain NY0313808BC1" /LENGTH=456 /DNA_ID=CAMNT_0050638989 /DNA_START=338 /DNA_END=1708 /DNA_ORIENTATION=-